LCEAVCPINKAEYSKRGSAKMRAYAAYAKDDNIRYHSSSGGIFTLLAECILAQKGVVYGAAFDRDYSVHHIGIDRVEDLEQLRGSKYVQSNIENIYVDVKSNLKQNRKVLFSGTACQIAGLLSFLEKEEKTNLYTIDILCHGVPSPKVWKKYLEEKQTDFAKPIEKVLFRSKTHGWKTYSINLRYGDNKEYECNFSKDPYMRLFLKDICLRPSCHDCRFKELPRVSDLTIGDCWGIEDIMPDMDDDKGTSVVIVNSEKGQEIWGDIAYHVIKKTADIDCLLPPTAASRVSVVAHLNRKRFFRKLKQGASIGKLLELLNMNLSLRIRLKVHRIVTRFKEKYIK